MGTAAPASASDPASICGPGYYNVWTDNLPASTVYVEFNGSTDCAVNIKTQNIGTPSAVSVYIMGPNGASPNNGEDYGKYSYYAGPVYAYAPHSCITWGAGDGYINRDYSGLCG
ncbi:hypothetical protein E6W39_04480 [Kitasatospora acidiphila]|uniref:Spore-associated protein A n=1 Tax=Kitasatospora acidiphila TaxID=2567942 RepID=A0A540VY34_9ACTN|nr:hypothetical protein [Kitasatospora acidiphila]TQF01637.1 hypothetical protein E6W39_04480 [Kitasatospora acidiphila]